MTKIFPFDDNALFPFCKNNVDFSRISNVTTRKKFHQEYITLPLLRILGNSVRPLCSCAERPQWALAASPSSCLFILRSSLIRSI